MANQHLFCRDTHVSTEWCIIGLFHHSWLSLDGLWWSLALAHHGDLLVRAIYVFLGYALHLHIKNTTLCGPNIWGYLPSWVVLNAIIKRKKRYWPCERQAFSPHCIWGSLSLLNWANPENSEMNSPVHGKRPVFEMDPDCAGWQLSWFYLAWILHVALKSIVIRDSSELDKRSWQNLLLVLCHHHRLQCLCCHQCLEPCV